MSKWGEVTLRHGVARVQQRKAAFFASEIA